MADRPGTSSFFAMPRGDRWYIAVVLVYSLLAFLPWWREIRLAGISLFGWLMASLMVLSPAIALSRLWRERWVRRRGTGK